MINLLIKGIFYVITKLFDLIFSPFLSIIFALFPSVGDYFNYITAFLSQALTYVRTILHLFLFTDAQIQAIFDYFIILFTIHVSLLAFRFAINIYNKFKI